MKLIKKTLKLSLVILIICLLLILFIPSRTPIYFCAGRYDYNTPSILIEKYFNHIVAPEKEIIWFEESAHFPHIEEPGKFAELAIRIKERFE